MPRTGPIVALAGAIFMAFTAAAAAQLVADRVPLKIPVEHMHKMGSCKGELTIDKWRFTFTSADKPEDSREWKLTDLKEAESKTPDELVLKTRESGMKTLGQERNYKFKVPGGIERAIVDYMNDRIG